MKTWWLTLKLREQQLLALGFIFLCVFLTYFIIWSPFNESLSNLQLRVESNKQLLQWMEATDLEIKKLETKTKHSSFSDSHSLLSTVQTSLKTTYFDKYASLLKQTENNSISLHFQNIEFDKLILWLTTLWKKNKIAVTQINIIPASETGIITSDVTLKKLSD